MLKLFNSYNQKEVLLSILTKNIQENSFQDFCKAVQSSVEEGYSFDFEDNLRFPSHMLNSYSCIMIKAKKNKKTQEDKEL